jgi:hypothetical protein
MSVTLPAPSAFKPTFVPEYFFEPPSPGHPPAEVSEAAAATEGEAVVGQPIDEPPPLPAPSETGAEDEEDEEEDEGGGSLSSPPAPPDSSCCSSSPAHDDKLRAVVGGEALENGSEIVAMECHTEADKQAQILPPRPHQEVPPFNFAVSVPSAVAPLAATGERIASMQVTPVHTSSVAPSISTGTSSAASTPGMSHVFFTAHMSGSSTSTTSSASASHASSPVGVSGHSLKVYQRLVDAAMADAQAHGGGANSQRPSTAAANDSTRKYSSASVMSSAASSTNSPLSSSSSVAQASTSVSASHTPSPPPLALPQSAHKATSSGAPDSSAPKAQPRAPASSPTRYRTVPSAASHISPVVVPVHAPYNATQHAQTPKHTSTGHTHRSEHHHTGGNSNTHPHHHHHRHHSPVTHSTPATPRQQQQPLVHLQDPSRPSDGQQEFVGPFVLGPVLGRGCTGTVRLGTHRLTQFEVAFKIIDKKYLIGEQEGTSHGKEHGGSTPTEEEVQQSKLWKKVKREIVILKLIGQ